LRIGVVIIRMLILIWLAAAVTFPILITHKYLGIRWAAIIAIVIIGVVAFLLRFGSYIIGAWLAQSIIDHAKTQTEAMMDEMDSGLWNPMKRDSVVSHAAAEGIDIPKKTNIIGNRSQ